MENENKGRLNFLDVAITRNKLNRFDTTIYRKPSANLNIINAKCRTPQEYKIASLRGYVNRAILVCSNPQLLKEEIYEIEKIATRNGFKKEIIKKLYKNRIKNLNRIQPAQKQKQTYTTPIPYMGIITHVLRNEAAKLNYKIDTDKTQFKHYATPEIRP